MPAAEDVALKVVERFYEEFWNQRKFEIAEQIFAPDAKTHQLRSGQVDTPQPRGPEVVRQHTKDWLEGFPDLRFNIDHSFASGELVMTRVTMEGTHTGEWLGLPATGKKAFVRIMAVHKVVAGRIAEDWVQVETLGFFQQLGVLPSVANIFVDHIERTLAAEAKA